MPGLKLVDGTVVDIGVLLDNENRIVLSPVGLPDYFNVATSITTNDADTVVIPAKVDKRIFITDMVIDTVSDGDFTLTNDAGATLIGPISLIAANGPFVVHFITPLVNEIQNDQVEFDKTAADDDWEVYLAGYYAP